jgi:sporulation related protein
VAGSGHIDVLRLILAGLVVIGGCSNTPDSTETYIGWHCEEPGRRGDIKCEQRQMTQGQPIAAALEDKVVESEPIPDSEKTPTKQKPLEIIWIGKNQPKPWREQLPGFTVETSTAANAPWQTSRAARVTPEPEPETEYIDDLDESSSEDESPTETVNNQIIAAANNQSDYGAVVNDKPEQAAKPDRVERSPASLLSDELNPGAGFTVQLGAFTTAQAAQQFLQDNDLYHLDIAKQEHESAGQDWHVLTFGYFTEKEAAHKAWLAATVNSADIDVWIRPVRQ